MKNPNRDQRREPTRWPGILKVHVRTCEAPSGRCSCGKRVRYQASAWSPKDGKRIRKHFAAEDAAKVWQKDASRAIASASCGHRRSSRSSRRPTL